MSPFNNDDPRTTWQTWLAFAILVLAFVGLAFFGQNSGRFYGQTGLISAALAVALLVLAWIDLDRYLLPDVMTLPLIGGGVLYSTLFGVGLWLSLAGALVGYSLIAGLAYYWRRRFDREGIGLGDAKLLAAGGAWIGLFGVPIILLVASGSALVIVGLFALIRRKIDAKAVVPFGPMLSFGVWAGWCLPSLLP